MGNKRRSGSCSIAVISALAVAIICSALITPMSAVAQEKEMILSMKLVPTRVEVGMADYSIGYVYLETAEGKPVIAPYDVIVDLRSVNSTIASVPASVTIPEGSDYAKFDISVDEFGGETEISAYLGSQIVSRVFGVIDSHDIILDDMELIINMPSSKLQLGAEMPISIFLETGGSILQAPKDIRVSFEYESSLIKISTSSTTIHKGSYYALVTVKALEKTGNAFIKASTSDPQLNTVENVEISSSLPASLDVHIFPERIGLAERNVDVFVSVLDSSGNPTLASDDIKLELFSSSSRLSDVKNVDAVIKKGEFGFYLRQSIFFTSEQDDIIIGASTSGLGAAFDTFDITGEPLEITSTRAQDRVVSVFTPAIVPNDSEYPITYQINALEDDDDDTDCDNNDLFDDGDDCDGDGFFDEHRDHNKDGLIDEEDYHAIDELEEGETYPIRSTALYSPTQGNLNVVSSDNEIAIVSDSGTITSDSSYGTATISVGKLSGQIGLSASLQDVGSGTSTSDVIGGISPVMTKIFSPIGADQEGNDRLVFDELGFSDMFLITMDSASRPSNSDDGARFLVKPINEIVEIDPGRSFANLPVYTDSFGEDIDSGSTTVSAIPIGINPNTSLQIATEFDLISHTGTTVAVTIPIDGIYGFSKSNPLGTVQLKNQFGNPVLATTNAFVSLTSSNPSIVQVPSGAIIDQGTSFAQFPVTMTGRDGNVTISASSDGFKSSSETVLVVLDDMNGQFVSSGIEVATATVAGNITVVAPEGTDVLWGVPSSFEILNKDEKAIRYDSTRNAHYASLQAVPTKEGEFTLDVTLLKDGYTTERLSQSINVKPFLNPLVVTLMYPSVSLPLNRAVDLDVLVMDPFGNPVGGAFVSVSTDIQSIADPPTAVTDSSGMAKIAYTITDPQISTKSIQVVASKDGYSGAKQVRDFEIRESLFGGLPSWTKYAVVVGAVGSIGGGVAYFVKKPKSEALFGDAENDEIDQELGGDSEYDDKNND